MYEKVDEKAIKAWKLNQGIELMVTALILIIGAIVDKILVGVRFWDVTILKFIIVGLLIIMAYQIIAFFIEPRLEYKQWGYIIEDEKIEIRHGIFFTKTVIIPVIKIQNITMKTGPIYKKYGLSKIEIALASGNFEIEALADEKAREISENLRKRLYERLEVKDGEEI